MSTPGAGRVGRGDRRAFVLPVPRAMKALVVNGAPYATRYRDEIFFVAVALTAPGSPVEVATRNAEVRLREDFSAYDLVLLLNVAAPGAEDARRLTNFEENGSGLSIRLVSR